MKIWVDNLTLCKNNAHLFIKYISCLKGKSLFMLDVIVVNILHKGSLNHILSTTKQNCLDRAQFLFQIFKFKWQDLPAFTIIVTLHLTFFFRMITNSLSGSIHSYFKCDPQPKKRAHKHIK